MGDTRKFLVTLPQEVRYMIFEHETLTQRDLFNILLASAYTRYEVKEVLYKKDARQGNSSAIAWAARVSASPRYRDSVYKTLDLSIRYGGNVDALQRRPRDEVAFATAFHIALANGTVGFAEELIALGASPSTFSRRLWKFLGAPRGGDVHDAVAAEYLVRLMRRKRIENHYTLPLLPALLRAGTGFTKLMFKFKPRGVLAVSKPEDLPLPNERPNDNLRAYTAHHLLISDDIQKSEWKGILGQFPDEITVLDPASGMTPLMKALERGDEIVTEYLLGCFQNYDILSPIGWTAMTYAVKGATVFDTPKKRDWSSDIVTEMLDKDADPNAGTQSYPLQIALMGLFDHIDSDPKHPQRLKELISTLLSFNADANLRVAHQATIGQEFFLKMPSPIPKLMREVFCEILSHGFQASNYLPDGTSMLSKLFQPAADKQKLAEKLLEYDAHLAPREIDDAFLQWVNRDKGVPTGLKWETYANQLTQGVINRAYLRVIETKDQERYNWLKTWCRPPTNTNRIVIHSIKNEFWNRNEIFSLPFNPAWRSRQNCSYAHFVIDRLYHPRYSEAQAIADIQALTQKGVMLAWKNDHGSTVHDVLRRLRKKEVGKGTLAKLERVTMLIQMQEDNHLQEDDDEVERDEDGKTDVKQEVG